jgi:hypothetical protein
MHVMHAVLVHVETGYPWMRTPAAGVFDAAKAGVGALSAATWPLYRETFEDPEQHVPSNQTAVPLGY